MKVITKTKIMGRDPDTKGKVRDIYHFGNTLLLVSTDRISAFDIIMANGIPGKGVILTELSKFWFKFIKEHVQIELTNHCIEFPHKIPMDKEIIRRSMYVNKVNIIPIECIVRGYITGSGWKEYKKNGTICDIPLPGGLKECEKLPEPLFTPSTKAEQGLHDENISIEDAKVLIGGIVVDRLEEISIELYKKAAEYALSKGIILADTKFEFGRDIKTGEFILADEVLTPDSSRYWPLSDYGVGRDQDSFDKQYVRNYLESINFNKKPPGPELPEEIVKNTQQKYLDIYYKLTGKEIKL
jgi:phosphoribosylaminoimidazole-succinocarboxamide synthase